MPNVGDRGLMLNVEQLASELKISKSKAYELVNMNSFPKIKLGKRILIPVDALKEWLSKNIGNRL